MDRLDALERLARLRETGILTEAEFEAQKTKLLDEHATVATQKQSSHVFWLICILVLLAGLVAIISIIVRGNEPSNSVAAVANDSTTNFATSAPNGNATAPVAPQPVPQSPYAWATSADVLGVTPEFLVSRLGAARERYPGSQTHEVGGCRITYTLQRAAVQSFYTEVTRECRPSLAGTPAARIPISPSLTFGQITQTLRRGEFVAAQLEGFGNAADPTVDLHVGGAHVDNFISVIFSSNTGFDNAASEALGSWDSAVRRQRGISPQDSVVDFGPFQCAHNPPANVATQLQRARVSSVTVGTELTSCS